MSSGGESLYILTLAFLVVGYCYYGIVHVPDDMDAHDDVMWMYGKRKLTRAIVSVFDSQRCRFT